MSSPASMSDQVVSVAATVTDKRLNRIALLLRQSEKAGTPEEAQTFAEKAQQLISLHSIDEAVARQRIAQIETRSVPVQRAIHIGERGKRGLATYVSLFLVIARANDVKCDIARSSTTVYAFGFAADIDACELIYTHLLVQMVEASNAYLRTGEYKSETRLAPVYTRDRWGRRWIEGHEDRPVHGSTARRSFQVAFAASVGARLRQAREHAIRQAEDARQAEPANDLPHDPETARAASIATTGQGTSTELVLKAKDVEIVDFYKQHSTARGSWRGDSAKASSGHSSTAARAGQRAGNNARLGVNREIG